MRMKIVCGVYMRRGIYYERIFYERLNLNSKL